ncbi:hypothetical protein [Lacimonas salitolerans]|uniref:OmpH family outer membrane protein n=1 Tax=Lacimonas salitolerans TaxID=1323750 RepID=A0ABW4EJ21_9RHOB
MKKLFITIALALTLFATAPAPQASAMTLQQQRNQTYHALGDILSELRTEFDATQAQFRASTDRAERDMLRQKLRSQRARFSFLVTTRRMARNFYTAGQLDTIIVRYDLPVSRS